MSVYTALKKKADLYSDMAKRVMLSVVPSAMNPTERHFTGGFDYKALKSATLGAKNLVKYGAKACVEELEHYAATKNANDEAPHMVYPNAKELIALGKSKEALQLCAKAFIEPGMWFSGFGGKPWHNIAKTILDIEEKRETLERIRKEAYSPNRDSNVDYLEMEVSIMKDIIVSMNVFDGLAHNTGSIMPKLIMEEALDLKRLSGIEDYEDKITRLMDAKELNDPMSVYKQVQDVMSLPENKHIFGDWIDRIEQSPEYGQVKSKEEIAFELDKVRFKKKMKAKVVELGEDFEALLTDVHQLNRATDTRKAVKELMGALDVIDEDFKHISEYRGSKDINQGLAIIRDEYRPYIQRLKDRVSQWNNNSMVELMNDIGRIRKMIANTDVIASSIV